jgi:hypothetical protein
MIKVQRARPRIVAAMEPPHSPAKWLAKKVFRVDVLLRYLYMC